jgi:8-oxo-dGTP pyrophosphatase MutT (NUDIX family)
VADHPIEELNPGAPTPPRDAAAVVLLRRGGRHSSARLEVLLGRRTPHARFMADVWVFPGGAVNGASAGDEAHRETALRELEEETAICLPSTEALVPFSRWITPEEVKVRYDTRFYLALAPAHAAPQADGEEIVELRWFAPAQALELHRAGELLLVFPTIKKLETLARFGSPEEAMATVGAVAPEPILPRIDTSGDEPRILLPGDPDY